MASSVSRLHPASCESAASGAVGCKTASGDVVVDEADGNSEIKTASGNVRVSRFTGAGLSVKTVSGDFTVGIPTGTELGFEADTMSGRVVLPDPAPAEQPVERSARLNFKSVSGDLRVRRHREAGSTLPVVDPRDSAEEAAFRAEARSWLENHALTRPRPADSSVGDSRRMVS